MTAQSFFLVLSQVSLKKGFSSVELFPVSIKSLTAIISNGWLWMTGISFALAAGIWLFVLKRYPFSLAYPLVSISYIFALAAAVFIFRENVPAIRWTGVAVIIAGIFLITKS